jgi:outer membrane lipoprotein-sorting protein
MPLRRIVLAAAACGSVLAAAAAPGDTVFLPDPAAKGRQIAEESERRNLGFGDTQATMRMILESPQHKASVRELRMKTLEQAGSDRGDLSLVIFDRPTDVEGTALLTHAKILDPDDQWIYIPSIARVKRIASSNRSGPFLGSEFAYEDFTILELRKYSYRWLKDDACPKPHDGLKCFAVERKPLYENSGYLRQVAWIDQKDFQLRSLEFYNSQDVQTKTLTLSDYHQYQGKYWRARDLYMQNHVTGRSTRVKWLNYTFKTGLAQADFAPDALTRLR